MRTTLNLDSDVLAAAKALAARQRQPLGKVVSALIRRSVEPTMAAPASRNGIPLFPVATGARPVTPQLVAEMLDETP